MIKVAICDDDNYTCEQIKSFLTNYSEECFTNLNWDIFHSGEELYQSFDCQYDIVFLDIEMGGMNGIETAKRIRERDNKVMVVFTTAILEYAPEGFKVNAFRYLVKPFEYTKFKKELSEIIEECNKKVTFLIRSDSSFTKIHPTDIDYVEASGRKLYFHNTNQVIESIMTLKEISGQLDLAVFCQVHKSFIINIAKIKKYNPKEVEMLNGDLVPISRHRFQQFRETYMRFWGERMI